MLRYQLFETILQRLKFMMKEMFVYLKARFPEKNTTMMANPERNYFDIENDPNNTAIHPKYGEKVQSIQNRLKLN